MPLVVIAGIIIGLFLLAYRWYGRALAVAFDLSNDQPTPATRLNDGVDYVPTKPPILLGQHFAAIAAVGPIVGPIAAGLEHGWFPSVLWIVLGAVFIGGVHDFSALVASVRHQARSVAELIKLYVSPRAYVVFLLFIWLSLQYVIVVFTDLTAGAFTTSPHGGGVAFSSVLYLFLAMVMGILLYRFKTPLWLVTLVCVPLVAVIIWVGQQFPVTLPAIAGRARLGWHLLILGYCVVASVIPLWLLLQPRGYLGSFFLYGTFVAGLVGLLVGGLKVAFPARIPTALFGFTPGQGALVFPLLFTTIACGACSGFHGIVSSGTTSKQLRRETDARLVGYGGMLLEGLVAVIAISTVMMLGFNDPQLMQFRKYPDQIYAHGIAKFLSLFGVDYGFALAFGTLAFATFIYDTLDVATRLGRYIFEELTGLHSRWGALVATLATLLLPLVCLFFPLRDAHGQAVPVWKIFWPMFGTSNQLLAALTLTGVTLWLKRVGKRWWVTGVPAAFMLLITLWSLLLVVQQYGVRPHPVGTTGVVLFALALYLLAETWRAWRRSAAGIRS